MFGPRGESVEVFVRPGPTDMRKAINGLAVLVEQDLELDPLAEGALYLFCNRGRRIMKALYWDATGFCLWQKRLEKHRFPWPESEETVKTITTEQLAMLLSGIDFWHAHQRLSYHHVS
jgi:transposase